jgi:soluble lytic murein transglycosylase
MKKSLTLILAALIAAAGFSCFKAWSIYRKASPFYQTIESYAYLTNIDPLLITSIILEESSFDVNARSSKGAIGLMQILPSTAKDISKWASIRYSFQMPDLDKPSVNIHFGTVYFYHLLNQFNDNYILALAAYNAGIGTVKTWVKENPKIASDISAIPYKETRKYVTHILRNYKWLKSVQTLKNLVLLKKMP